MNRQYSFLLLFCFSLYSYSQTQTFSRQNDWKKYRREVFGGVGVSQFLGDLGGGKNEAAHFSPKDMNAAATRIAIGIGGRYKIESWLNVAVKFSYLRVSGDDKLSKEEFRRGRNLNFKSNIFELTPRMEAGWQSNPKRRGTHYSLNRMRNRYRSSLRYSTHSIFAFAGIGGFYYNPKGQTAAGNLVNLRPLHTEGQGLPNGPKQYSRLSVCVPVGIYYKYSLNRQWAVGVELSYRKTFTDYIDDVGGGYYNKAAIEANYGALAAQMSDPNVYENSGATLPAADGTPARRGGNAKKDTYMSLEVNVSYTFKQSRRISRLRSKF